MIIFSWQIARKLDEILWLLKSIQRKEVTIMATLDDVLADVTAETGQIDSIGVLIAGLKQQIADALSGAVHPPVVQAKVDANFTQAETNTAKIADALNANP
jgi:hypothetical protein